MIQKGALVLAVTTLVTLAVARWSTRDAAATAPTTTATAATSEDILDKPAPDFELEAVNGKAVKLSALKGKVVVLDFWAVWCGPCQDSVPFFQKLADAYGKDGLEVIGMHVDDGMPPVDKVQEYLDDKGVSYTNLVSTVDVDNEFMVYAMPTTYIIDREGIIRKRHVGYNPDKTPGRLEKDVVSLLKE